MRILQGLNRVVQQRPDAVATVCGGRIQSYRELQSRVSRLAGGLQQLGLCCGARIAMLGFNSDHYLEYYLAVPWIGAVVVPVNFRWSLSEIIYSLNDAEVAAIILDDTFSVHGEILRAACPHLRHILFCGEGQTPAGKIGVDALIAASPAVAEQGLPDDALFGIFYTGGTTGAPKGVMLSQANICAAALGLMMEGAFPAHAIGLHAAPMFHLADMMMVTSLLLRGATHVMLPAFKPELALAAIRDYAISDLLLVPAMLQALLDYPERTDSDLDSVQRVVYGAAPASETLLERAMTAMPKSDFIQVYGMTELAGVISILPAADHQDAKHRSVRLRSAGRSACHAEVRIVGPDDEELERGHTGEILVRGPSVMQGYLNRPDTTAAALKDGWMHTEDAGFMDEYGYIHIVDRLKDMIISGGENIYSIEVENAIAKHPAVASCAVLGIPNEEWGEAVHAAVVLKTGMTLTQEELYVHCKQWIAGYKCPRSMQLLDALPLSGTGKILKTALRKSFQ